MEVKKAAEWMERIAFLTAILVMMLAAELCGEREIIFPEIAALSIGCFLSPKLCWKTNYTKMIFFIELCAVLGVIIVVCTNIPLWMQVSLAYGLGQLVYILSGTSLAPMISAIVLPVLMQTRSIVYPVAALLLLLLLVALRLVLEKLRVKEVNLYEPTLPPARSDWMAFLFRTGLVAVLAYFCVKYQVKFCIAPPLLVAFTELCRMDCPAGDKKLRVFLLVSLCAGAGAAARGVFVMKCGISTVAVSLVIGVAVILLVKIFHLYFPPAGAMAVLALLIPDEAVSMYPLQVAAGMLILLFAATIWVKMQKTAGKAGNGTCQKIL